MQNLLEESNPGALVVGRLSTMGYDKGNMRTELLETAITKIEYDFENLTRDEIRQKLWDGESFRGLYSVYSANADELRAIKASLTEEK